jgi:hypothetical protein
LTPGGVAIGQDAYIGETLYVRNNAFINNIYITSDTNGNFIESPDQTRTNSSFIPINFTNYNNTKKWVPGFRDRVNTKISKRNIPLKTSHPISGPHTSPALDQSSWFQNNILSKFF